MGWDKVTSASSFDAKATIQTQLDGRGKRDLTADGSIFAGFSEYSLVGIKAGSVEGMREQIRIYVKEIEAYMSEALTNATAQMDTAFRGNVLQESVKAYLTKVKDYCDNLVSHLLTFSDKLADVSNAWLAATQSMGQNVDSATGSFAAGTKYVDNMTTNSR